MTKLEYIWTDGVTPTPQLRSKTKVISDKHWVHQNWKPPVWGFDGSSTEQAPGDNSDCVLQPVRWYENPLDDGDSLLVLCEVWNVDEKPHETNNRFQLEGLNSNYGKEEVWVGFEQEYTLFKNGNPLGWPEDGSEPKEQGDYYCGRNIGEDIAREHMDACIEANIGITGINSEVMLGQWEYQIFAENPVEASDDLWVARWLMEKIAAKHGVSVSLEPKPKQGDWNGAGMHTNFSTKWMRGGMDETHTGLDEINEKINLLRYKHDEHILVYGTDNEQRLTGKHETCDINTFRDGISDRGASIRIPWQVVRDKCGYLEDRRPSANADPYMVSWRLIKTICI
jgi:glutamine synthetase